MPHHTKGRFFSSTPWENFCQENSRTPLPPHPCLKGHCVLLSQRKWALAVCTLKEVCVCLNTALFQAPFNTALTVLTLRTVLVTGTSVGPDSAQGSGLAGKEREDRWGKSQARRFYLTSSAQGVSGSVPKGGCHCQMWCSITLRLLGLKKR